MAVTIEMSPERETKLKAQAQARGLTVEQWLFQLADLQMQAEPASFAHLQKTNPEDWKRQFRAWAESHDPNLPTLSDEAMSRESIYPHRN